MIESQQKDAWCGPAALSYVMDRQGISVSQSELAKKLHTNEDGTDENDIIRVAHEYGFRTVFMEGVDPDGILNDLTRYVQNQNFPIVDYIMGDNLYDDGHFSVITGITNWKIVLWNPQLGREEVRSRKGFIKNWIGEGSQGHREKYKFSSIVLVSKIK